MSLNYLRTISYKLQPTSRSMSSQAVVVPHVKKNSRPSGFAAYAKAVRKYNIDTPVLVGHQGMVFKRHTALLSAHQRPHRSLRRSHHHHGGSASAPPDDSKLVCLWNLPPNVYAARFHQSRTSLWSLSDWHSERSPICRSCHHWYPRRNVKPGFRYGIQWPLGLEQRAPWKCQRPCRCHPTLM